VLAKAVEVIGSPLPLLFFISSKQWNRSRKLFTEAPERCPAGAAVYPRLCWPSKPIAGGADPPGEAVDASARILSDSLAKVGAARGVDSTSKRGGNVTCSAVARQPGWLRCSILTRRHWQT
jgi:hypothetical protein